MSTIDPDALRAVIDLGRPPVPVVAADDEQAEKDKLYAQHRHQQREDIINRIRERKALSALDVQGLSIHFLLATECGADLGIPAQDMALLPEKKLQDVFAMAGRRAASDRIYVLNSKFPESVAVQGLGYAMAVGASGGTIAGAIAFGVVGALGTVLMLRSFHDTYAKREARKIFIEDLRKEIAEIKSTPIQ